MSNFLGGWMRGIWFVLVGIVGVCALFAGCTAMIVVPVTAFIAPYEYFESKWLGGIIGGVCFLIVFGGIFALLDDA